LTRSYLGEREHHNWAADSSRVLHNQHAKSLCVDAVAIGWVANAIDPSVHDDAPEPLTSSA
jgi:hypothetical protein